MTSDCTFVLLNYERQEYLKRLVHEIYSQSIKSEILLVDNSREGIHLDVERTIHIPWNAGCCARLTAIPFVNTKYVCFIDDDLGLKDSKSLERWINIYEEVGAPIIGGFGAQAYRDGYRWNHQSSDGYYNVIKGRHMLFDIEVSHVVPLNHPVYCEKQFYRRGKYFEDDIYLSLCVSHGTDVLFSDDCIRNELVENGDSLSGLSAEPKHIQIREAVCRYLFASLRLEENSVF